MVRNWPLDDIPGRGKVGNPLVSLSINFVAIVDGPASGVPAEIPSSLGVFPGPRAAEDVIPRGVLEFVG